MPLLPQIHELQVILNKLKVLKFELSKAFQVGVIVEKLPSSWKGYQKKILLKSEDYSLEEIQKHLRIKEESRSRDKMMGLTKPMRFQILIIIKVKITIKNISRILVGPKKNSKAIQGQEKSMFYV